MQFYDPPNPQGEHSVEFEAIMSGRLIILPKKTWNVWNREAIAKVRNDEREHALAVNDSSERQRRLDSEARLEVLRRRAGGGGSGGGGQSGQPLGIEREEVGEGGEDRRLGRPAKRKRPVDGQTEGQQGHINFFADFERALGGNADQEKEKREREQLELKRAGIAPLPLGGSQTTLPWWVEAAPAQQPPPRVVSGVTREACPQAESCSAGLRTGTTDGAEDGASGEIKTVEGSKARKGEKKKQKKKKSNKKHKRNREEKQQAWAALREKRLQREAREAKRFKNSQGLSDGALPLAPGRYHEQFHPLPLSPNR